MQGNIAGRCAALALLPPSVCGSTRPGAGIRDAGGPKELDETHLCAELAEHVNGKRLDELVFGTIRNGQRWVSPVP